MGRGGGGYGGHYYTPTQPDKKMQTQETKKERKPRPSSQSWVLYYKAVSGANQVMPRDKLSNRRPWSPEEKKRTPGSSIR